MRAFLAVLALVMLCGARYPANADRGVPLATEHYARAWARVQECSERQPIAGHDFSHLVMFAVPNLELDGHPIFAQWIEGDTIWLDESLSDTSWMIDHEMLHALLQGPAGAEKHPMQPFAFPCKLLELQHTPGGIMGSYRR
jgi:hypothetical protein